MLQKSASQNGLYVENALRSMLGKTKIDSSTLFDANIVSLAKKTYCQNVEFDEGKLSERHAYDCLPSKFVIIEPQFEAGADSDTELKAESVKTGMKVTKPAQGKLVDECGMPLPSKVLFPPENVCLEWQNVQRVGAGLINLGNTCFLNATMQCLAYTPPLYNYLTSGSHASECKSSGFCMTCELQKHVRQCFQNGCRSFKPVSVLQKLKLIAKHMKWGRQEDAHEFLRYVIDSMLKSQLIGHERLDFASKETTIVQQIFGGYFCSQVVCQKCQHKSEKFDPFLDICIEVKNINSIEMGLRKFVEPEMLSGKNAYSCASCKRKVDAKKSLKFHKTPNVLTVQFKRYLSTGGKVSRHIAFSEKLNMRPYMSRHQGGAINYQLYAVLVHDGFSTDSGHYYCYVRGPNRIWHCMNDDSVRPTGLNQVLQAQAYLLFYVKEKLEPTQSPSHIDKVHEKPKSLQKTPVSSHSPCLKGLITNGTEGSKKVPNGSSLPPMNVQKSVVMGCNGDVPSNGASLVKSPVKYDSIKGQHRPETPKVARLNGALSSVKSPTEKNSGRFIAEKADSVVLNGNSDSLKSPSKKDSDKLVKIPKEKDSGRFIAHKADSLVLNGNSESLKSPSKKDSDKSVKSPAEKDSVKFTAQKADSLVLNGISDSFKSLSKKDSDKSVKSPAEKDSVKFTAEKADSLELVLNGISDSFKSLSKKDSDKCSPVKSVKEIGAVVKNSLKRTKDGKSKHDANNVLQESSESLLNNTNDSETMSSKLKKRVKLSATVKNTVVINIVEPLKQLDSSGLNATSTWVVKPLNKSNGNDIKGIGVRSQSLEVISNVISHEGDKPTTSNNTDASGMKSPEANGSLHLEKSERGVDFQQRHPQCEVQKWDDRLHKSYRTLHSSFSESPKKIVTWDGQRNRSDMRQLGNLSFAYGTEVSTWDGEKSTLDDFVSKENKKLLKRRRSEEADDLDKGRMKKFKQPKVDYYKGVNPFEQMQVKSDREKQAKTNMFTNMANRPQSNFV